MYEQYEKLVGLGERMLKSKKDYDVLNFRAQYIRCISGRYGNIVKVQSYLYMDTIITRLEKMGDVEFQKAVCGTF